MGQHDLAGSDLDGNGTVDLSQKRPKSQLPWFYRGKSTAVNLPRRAMEKTRHPQRKEEKDKPDIHSYIQPLTEKKDRYRKEKNRIEKTKRKYL